MRKLTVTSLKIRLAVNNEQKAIINLFLLSFAKLSSCKYSFLGNETLGCPSRGRNVGTSVADTLVACCLLTDTLVVPFVANGIEDVHLDFPWTKASKKLL